MSVSIDTAEKLRDQQVAAVNGIQSLMVTAVGVVVGLTGKAPKLPQGLRGSAQKLAAPWTKIVGTPNGVRAYAVASSREWLEVQRRFHVELLDAVCPSEVVVEVPRKAGAKQR